MKHLPCHLLRLLWLLLLAVATMTTADAQTVASRYRNKDKQTAPRSVYVSICESRSATPIIVPFAGGWQGVRMALVGCRWRRLVK